MNFSKSFVIIFTLFGSLGSVGWAQSANGSAGPPGDDPPVTVDGDWQQFNWHLSISPTNSDGAFTWIAASPVLLDVTDAYIDGDWFQVLDFGASLGLTSDPTDDGSWTNAPDAAFADPRWSSATFPLGAGAHSIQLVAVQTATGFSDGTGYLRVESELIPEPSTFALAGLGIVALLGGCRMRCRS